MSLTDAQRNEVIALIGQYGANRRGLVLSYQPSPPMAKVLLQPEGIETGWLPVLSPWTGNGWGMVAPLQPNDQVMLVCEEADGANYAIKGRYFSDVDAAPTGAAAGELLLQHASGAQIWMKHDGSILIAASTINLQAPGGGNATVNVTGTLNVSVETVTAGKAFTPHVHGNVQNGGGQTGGPVG